MAFKMVTDSEKAAGRIAGMAKAHAEQMTAQQMERWRGSLPDDAEDVGIGQIQLFYAAKLRRRCRALARAEKAHIRQLTAIKLLRQQRDGAAAQVRLKAHRVEKVLQGRHGDVFAEVTLEKAAEVTDPMTLRRVAVLAAKNLVDPRRQVPEPLVSGTELDFSDLAWEIAEPAGRLSAHLDDLEDQLPLLSATLERKIRTLDAVKDLTRRLARFLAGLYGLEGHDELQAKVMQALKRARKAVDAVERRQAAEAAGDEAVAQRREAGDEAGDAKAETEAAENAVGVTAEDEDGRLRKIEERLALREDPMSDFDEGMREALAEAEEYQARLQAAASGDGADQAEAEEADAESGPQEPPGTGEAAAAVRVEAPEAGLPTGSAAAAEPSTEASVAAEGGSSRGEATLGQGGNGADPGASLLREGGGPHRRPDG